MISFTMGIIVCIDFCFQFLWSMMFTWSVKLYATLFILGKSMLIISLSMGASPIPFMHNNIELYRVG